MEPRSLLDTDQPLGSSLDPAWRWARIVAFVGVPSLLSLFLVYWLTTNVSAKQDAILSEQATTREVLLEHKQEMHTNQAVQRSLLRAICLGVNRTVEAKALCEVGR